jgi:ABC-type transport system involved in cytochrome c biogenesis permease component
MKFYVRRFIASLLAVPIVFGVYILGTTVLAGLSSGGGLDYSVLIPLGAVWVGFVTFAPEVWRFVNRVSTP